MSGPIAEPELHLLPTDFVGAVVIRHGVPGRAAAGREGGARVYAVPADGVLEVSDPPNWGVRDPAAMRFCYEGVVRRALAVHAATARAAPASDAVAVLGGYQVGRDFHYAVDRPSRAARYPNPALAGAARPPGPAAPESLLRFALYPVLRSARPADPAEIDRGAAAMLAGGDTAAAVLAALRDELAAPAHDLAALRPADAPAGVTDRALREYLAAVADRIAAGLRRS